MFATLGPAMPKGIHGHSMVSFNGDLYTIGGYYGQFTTYYLRYDQRYQTAIFKLSCNNQNCNWTTTNQKLSAARSDTVAIQVRDSLVNSGNGSLKCYLILEENW